MIGNIIKVIENNGSIKDTVIIFSSDHEGINKSHGDKTLEEIEIPWIIYSNAPAKGELKNHIIIYDIASAIAHILGLKTPDFLIGKPVLKAFKKQESHD